MANNKKRKPRKVNSVKTAATANTKTENANIQTERPAYGYSSHTPKKSMVLRILILVVAGLMFIGAIAIPFFSVFRAG